MQTRKSAGVSRREFMRSAAGVAAVPAALTGSTLTAQTWPAPGDVTVAATVVRATHSRTTRHALRLGVRVSIDAPDARGFRYDREVLVIEPVTFGASQTEAAREITSQIQARVAEMLQQHDYAADPDAISVQLFGGVL